VLIVHGAFLTSFLMGFLKKPSTDAASIIAKSIAIVRIQRNYNKSKKKIKKHV